MPSSELEVAYETLHHEIESRKNAKLNEIVAAAQHLAKELNLPVNDIITKVIESLKNEPLSAEAQDQLSSISISVVSTASKIQEEERSRAKYVNPQNPDQTWSGLGRRPLWLNKMIEGGASLSDFLTYSQKH